MSPLPPGEPAPLAPTTSTPPPVPLATEAPSRCRNCEAPLFGSYCSACGQQARGSARALSTLLFDARDALVHLDSRLWRTLHLLALRPGRLTAEYFAERRARYLPPFRLYLVVSLAFFSLATLERIQLGDEEGIAAGLKEEVRQELQKDLASTAREMQADPATPPQAVAAVERALRELEKRGPTDPAAGPEKPGEQQAGAPRRRDASPEESCEQIEVSGSPRLQAALISACKRHTADRGRSLWRSVAANIPRMMFVFLPLMALFLKAIYWRPRRYYVEHLVFFLHAHAAVFLVSIGAMGLRALARALGADGLAGLLAFGAWAYATWYVFRALRVYYGQGKLATGLKFLALGVAYLTFLTVTLVGTVAISAAMAS